jgi:hypothetical protein
MSRATISAQADAGLLKEITKMIHRIERILVPSNSLVHSTIGERLDGLLKQIKKGVFFEDVNMFPVEDLIGYEVKSIEPLFRKVNWVSLEHEIWNVVGEGNAEYTLPPAVQVEIYTEKTVHTDKLEKAAGKERVRRLQVSFELILRSFYSDLMNVNICLSLMSHLATKWSAFSIWKMAQRALWKAHIRLFKGVLCNLQYRH